MLSELGGVRSTRLRRGSCCSGGRLLPPLLKPFGEPETACALAPLFGEHVQFLVEAVRYFLLQFIEMALVAPVKLGWLQRHAISFHRSLVDCGARYHTNVINKAGAIHSPDFVIESNRCWRPRDLELKAFDALETRAAG